MQVNYPQTIHNTKFQPYAENGGSIVAIGGEDYSVIGADTRLSSGFMIHSRELNKLFKLSEQTVFAATGCWADTLTLAKLLQTHMQTYQLDNWKPMPTASVAQMLSTLLYYKRFFPYGVSCVLAGLDGEGRGCVYSFDCLGHIDYGQYHASGSAGPLLQPLLDNQIGCKNMLNVTEAPVPRERATVLLKDVFISAAERDIKTGDNVHILTITADGIGEDEFELRKD